jgi:ferredoxin
MGGTGPTQAPPRHIGLLLASVSPHTVDAVCCELIGLSEDAVPTLPAARERGLLPHEVTLITVGATDGKVTAEDYAVKDFEHVAVRHGHLFASKGKLVSKVLEKLLTSRPKLKASECVVCAKCANICPAKAIDMVDRKAVIDRDRCIRCFCCQEFCPTGAMKVHRTWIARMLVKSKR